MQRMKMVHQRKLEAARELYGLSPTDEIAEEELKMKAKERLDFWKVDETDVPLLLAFMGLTRTTHKQDNLGR